MPLPSTRSRDGSQALRGLLALLLPATALLAFAAPASAQPDVPQLGGTYPSSPGVSTTPRVYGWAGEVVISSFGLQDPIAPTAEEGEAEGGEGTIEIYTTADCTGPVAATGTRSDLQNSGIPVSVSPGSTTVLSAIHSDLTGESPCSNAIEYRQVSDPPSPPVITGVDPASPADDNQPHVLGSAAPGATVAIYSNSSCSGAALGAGSAGTLESTGIQVGVPDNSTTTFYARASWAELPSACSSTSVTYREVSGESPAPGGGDGGGGDAGSPAVGGGAVVHSGAPAAPRLRTVPGGRSTNSLPLVVGAAAGASRVQIYRNAACVGPPAASGSPAQLSAGFAIQVAENATTKFYGEAIDASGTASDCSEPVSYVEDSSPPLTRITFGPGVKTRKRVAVFRFADITDDPPGTTFLCKFDRRSWRACQAPLKLPHLRPKAHTLRVKAIDAAGNEEAGGASRRFKVVRGL